MTAEWEWGLEPYSRRNLPPAVSNVLYSPTFIMSISFLMLVCCFHVLMPSGPLVLMQRFPRQATEDGSDPADTWGPDRVEADMVDPDDEDNVPIPVAVPGPATGKTCASSIPD